MMSSKSLGDALRARFALPAEGNPLAAPLCYALGDGGALVRPRLALLAASRCGWDSSHALDHAAAVELFHTASLILDDLPCMDDAERRRGRPCVHRVHGEAHALLVTVFMINRAFFLANRAVEGLGFAARTRAAACADAELGAEGVLLGQCLDLQARRDDSISPARVANLKTGTLLRYALLLPVVARGAAGEEPLLDKLTRVWGELYQLCDDMRDAGVFSRDPGKDASADARTGSPNAVHASGAEASIARYVALLGESESLCAALEAEHPAWAGLAAYHAMFAAPYAESLRRAA